MRVLIVEHNADLGRLWSRFLARRGVDSDLATSQAEAIKFLRFNDYDALVLELVLPDGGAIAISDYATYRNPAVPIITVTNSSFFSDGSIFELIPNARSMMSVPVRPDDLAAVVEHFGAPPGPKAEAERKRRA
jgi:DNA-binding NtrC family response regulator